MNQVSPLSWKRALGLSLLAIYGPFAVMALFALLTVSCSHCKAAAWMVLPCAPAVIPFATLIRWFDLPQAPNLAWFAAPTFITSLAMVFLFAWLLRWKQGIRPAAVGIVLAGFSWSAVVLLMQIRA